jgi:hypothetical protein
MTGLGAQSDQLYTWSDNHAGRILCDASAAARIAATGTPAFRRGAQGLAHRTLQALREAWLQMRPGAGAWPQILSFGKPFERAAVDGICTPGQLRAGCGMSWQLPPHPPNSRRTLRHQPRTLAPPRGVLSDGHGRDGHPARRMPRHRTRWLHHRQYARRLAGRRRITEYPRGGLP